jgi:hypothetical protein
MVISSCVFCLQGRILTNFSKFLKLKTEKKYLFGVQFHGGLRKPNLLPIQFLVDQIERHALWGPESLILS